MFSAKVKAWIRVYVAGGTIIGAGFWLYNNVVPTPEELLEEFSPELREKYFREKELRELEQRELIKIVKQTMKSNDPIWKTGPIKSPWERDSLIVDKVKEQQQDTFKSEREQSLELKELKRIREELSKIRNESAKQTEDIVNEKRKNSWFGKIF
ncbi:hypothetical protein QEN19_002624 [Hanseniaspora menglaensis]